MWRAFFCAIGVSALILGGEFLLIERATLTLPPEQDMQNRPFLQTLHNSVNTREFVPPEWAPWTLLSVGAVLVLYSTTVARE